MLKKTVVVSIFLFGFGLLMLLTSGPVPAESQKTQSLETAENNGLQLPRRDPHFSGNIGTTFSTSDPAVFPQPDKAPEGAPNIVLILLDDVGFGQFEVSGGMVPSPNMNKLAAEGIFYNRFHTTALCAPTRAALLTGRTSHQANFGVISEISTGYDGYTAVIPRSTATIGKILGQNGYVTAWIGKNHNTPPWETSQNGPFDRWPSGGLGFDYFYGFNSGDNDQWAPSLMEDRTPVPPSKDPDYIMVKDFADKSIAWLKRTREIQPDKPFFLYLATLATHAPHQVPKKWIEKFKGKFDMGWDKYREMTIKRQKKMGIIPQNTDLAERPESLPAWDTLSVAEKKLYARMMEIFAAYGAFADYQVGRVIDYVKSLPDADNTMIIYIIGDNGSSAEGGLHGLTNENQMFNGFNRVPTVDDILKVYDELGGPKHFNHFPAGWTVAMCTPFKWTKQVASDFGGTRNGLIVDWPAKIKHGKIRRQFHHVVDIYPTILEVVGINAPREVDGIEQKPVEGISMAYTFADPEAEGRRKSMVFELICNRGMYEDGWFAGSMSFIPWMAKREKYDPFTQPWKLFNINKDFSLAHDLADKYPEKLEKLKSLWWAEAGRTDILPLDWRGVERFSAKLSGRPVIAGDTKDFIYTSRLTDLPLSVAPNVLNRSFRITADVEIGKGDEGMIITQGGIEGGFAFMVKDQKLVFAYNFLDMSSAAYTIIESSEKTPTGKVTLAMDFVYQGGKKMAGPAGITLYINGKKTGHGTLPRTVPMIFSLSETQDIGSDHGTSVAPNYYKAPFKFTGKLDRVVLELK